MRTGVTALALFLACSGQKDKKNEPASNTPTAVTPAPRETARPPMPVAQTPTVPPIDVTAKQLFDDYTASEAKADAMYKGKMLRVTGKIDVVSGDHANFSTYDLSAGPQAYFVDRRVPRSMREDQKITVECRCEGFIAPTVPVPKLVDCVLK